MEIKIEPIGYVNSEFRKPEELHFACEKGRLADTEEEIVIRRGLQKGLEGLEKFSHIWVIYLLHKAGRIEMRTHPGPPGVKGLPKVGVFSSRSQYRPNHMALRLARLLERKGNIIRVKGLDAIDGSPVLDIKPFVPHFDKPGKGRVADWYKGWTL